MLFENYGRNLGACATCHWLEQECGAGKPGGADLCCKGSGQQMTDRKGANEEIA